jgi:hypothetical protein
MPSGFHFAYNIESLTQFWPSKMMCFHEENGGRLLLCLYKKENAHLLSVKTYHYPGNGELFFAEPTDAYLK